MKLTDPEILEGLELGKQIIRDGRLFPIRIYQNNSCGYFVECQNEKYSYPNDIGSWSTNTEVRYAQPFVLTYQDLISNSWRVCN